ncbi:MULTISPECIES: hypothetical protein [Pseudomonas]|uniref:hypothetical protein n=1 Tax=Pseudomonas putida TaxID=303 RepID=UPI000D7578DB|nr:hypothetical protein [Pseudomonas putida]
MNNEEHYNQLQLLSNEDYKKTFQNCVDGRNFTHLQSHETIARALVTFLFECNYLKDDVTAHEFDILEMMTAIKGALSQAAYIDVKEAILTIRDPFQALLNRLDE